MATHDISQLQYADPLVQSPSATNQWMTCQQLWVYTQQYGLRGDVVQTGRKLAGLMHFFRSSKPLRPIKDEDRYLAQLASLAILETSKAFGPPLYSELTLGRARLDEVFSGHIDDTMVVPVIIDYKYFPRIDGDKQAELLADRFAYDHQLMHYAWAYSQYVGRWHSRVLDHTFLKIGVCLLTDKPEMMVFPVTWVVSKDKLMRWLRYAVAVWHQMVVAQQFVKGATQVDMPRNLKSCHGTVYGQCNMYDRCWVPSA